MVIERGGKLSDILKVKYFISFGAGQNFVGGMEVGCPIKSYLLHRFNAPTKPTEA